MSQKKIVYTSGEGSEKLYNCSLVICRQILETGLALGNKNENGDETHSNESS